MHAASPTLTSNFGACFVLPRACEFLPYLAVTLGLYPCLGVFLDLALLWLHSCSCPASLFNGSFLCGCPRGSALTLLCWGLLSPGTKLANNGYVITRMRRIVVRKLVVHGHGVRISALSEVLLLMHAFFAQAALWWILELWHLICLCKCSSHSDLYTCCFSS